jgi:hypothetical protein
LRLAAVASGWPALAPTRPSDCGPSVLPIFRRY